MSSSRTYPTELKRILEEEGRKQAWLARRAGISTSRLSHIVNGLHPSEDEASALARALGRAVGDIWDVGSARDAA